MACFSDDDHGWLHICLNATSTAFLDWKHLWSLGSWTYSGDSWFPVAWAGQGLGRAHRVPEFLHALVKAKEGPERYWEVLWPSRGPRNINSKCKVPDTEFKTGFHFHIWNSSCLSEYFQVVSLTLPSWNWYVPVSKITPWCQGTAFAYAWLLDSCSI